MPMPLRVHATAIVSNIDDLAPLHPLPNQPMFISHGELLMLALPSFLPLLGPYGQSAAAPVCSAFPSYCGRGHVCR